MTAPPVLTERKAGPSTGRVRPDPRRLGRMLASIRATAVDAVGDGVSRIAFTAAESAAHELVRQWLVDLGVDVHQDAAGNTIGERRGRTGGPAIAMGSHLDSVFHGGAYDGVVGVVSAVEVVRLLEEAGVETRHPVRVVAFRGEEGARFGEPCLGSKMCAGSIQTPDLEEIRDADGMSLGEAMQGVGLDPAAIGAAGWDPADWAAFLELHIEQADVLEREGLPIGVVEAISGSTRLAVRYEGRAAHSGGTPMRGRRDALTGAAELVLAVESVARNGVHRGTRATVGRLDVAPNNQTTIPGRVDLTIDVRDIDSLRQREATSEIVREAQAIAKRRALRAEIRVTADTSPTVLSSWLRRIVHETVMTNGIAPRVMVSGPGHDAAVINRVTPAALIFVPSRGGLSHVPEEWTSTNDIGTGVEVLRDAVLRVDRFLGELEDTTDA